MTNKDFFEAVHDISLAKGVSEEALYAAIKNALIMAVKADYDNKDIIGCDMDPVKKKMRVYALKTVVEEVEDPIEQLNLDQAKRIKKNAIIGDIIEQELETKQVSRIAASKGKHILRQVIMDAEKEQIRIELSEKIGQMVSARVVKVDPVTKDCIIEIGKITEHLPRKVQLPGDDFSEGDYTKVYIADLKETTKGPKAIISRADEGLVKRLIEAEVPEMSDGTVELMRVVREPGSRSKIAVYSANEQVDAVGACIGQKGARINKIVDLIGGEKIDVISYSDDPATFIAAALAPASVISVEILDESERASRAIVPNDQLSLAIGNKGQNVRLAHRLTGWKIDIKPEIPLQAEGENMQENEIAE